MDLMQITRVNKIISYIVTVSSLFSLISCSFTPSTVAELEQYVMDESSGLIQEQQQGAIHMQMVYRPTDLLVAHELSSESTVDTSKIRMIRAKYNSYAYFILDITQDEKNVLYQRNSQQEFSQLLQNLSFRMGNYVQMTTSEQDTIPLIDFAYPRLYSYGSSTQVMLVFSRDKLQQDEWIQLTLDDLGLGTGRQHFRFRMKDIANAPELTQFREKQVNNNS